MTNLFGRRWLALLALGLAQVSAAGMSLAHEPANPNAVGDLRTLIPASKLIVHGKVTGVVYVNGQNSAGRPAPHGFVTYQIDEVLFPKEQANRTAITLRVIGGPDGQGRFLDVVGVPKFQVGDEDILFLRSNGEGGCAVVMCEFGRYRVADGSVYEGHGSPVVKITTGRISTSGIGPAKLQDFTFPAPSFDELMKNPSAQARLAKLGMTQDEARQAYAADAPKQIKLGEAAVPAVGTPRLGLQIGLVLTQLRSAIGLLQPATPPVIADSDPRKAFSLPANREIIPPK